MFFYVLNYDTPIIKYKMFYTSYIMYKNTIMNNNTLLKSSLYNYFIYLWFKLVLGALLQWNC